MKVLDIAPHRSKRHAFSVKFAEDGHEVVTVPGRREALEVLQGQNFDLALLDANSDMYNTKELVAELEGKAQNDDLVIAIFVEPRNRPPRHRIAGRSNNVIVLQDGSVDHMARMIHLALSVREK